ncbi:type I inositol polyphosphate 5-phosphatase 8-like [Papaver somniferum]|uniref:type I inositol polyphosphate 5-phosphatase 8-like n=1 Tax=Papaver somniferum TaxID=3469 RepID=UPI000E6FEB37|nr:type I inositol polyphosphate 5-phosphatase 8-like [Papaver somniferum]
MRTESSSGDTMNYKSSWPKQVVRKWLNIQGGAKEFHSDYKVSGNFLEMAGANSVVNHYDFLEESPPEKWLTEIAPESLKRPRIESDSPAPVSDPLNQRIFVGTWNAGGKCPHEGLNLKDWLLTPVPADIYVLGFQEIVPLNAGNVLGAEDDAPALKWLSLIRQALNNTENSTELTHRHQELKNFKTRISFSDLISLEDELDKEDLERHSTSSPNSDIEDESSIFSMRRKSPKSTSSRYSLAASKQMVGIFLCVWVRTDLNQHVSNLKVSCVGRGIMGYLGNKGSVSISMTLNQTTFCFVCTHLASGEKEGDEVRRNFDVIEILKKTKFSQSQRVSGQPFTPSPVSILEHDHTVWLGDLNYRLAFPSGDTDELLENKDWETLLKKDQLMIEQSAGRVFEGWEEGSISFAPTYKYLDNSDQYVAQNQTPKSKEKRRTPAWCDRILWKGKGMKQMWYVRGENKFSDHRPVYSLFSVQLDSPIDGNKVQK